MSNAKPKPTRPETLVSIRARFKDMKVDNTRLDMIEAEISDLMEETEAVVAIDRKHEADAEKNGQTIKYSEMEVISVIGPTGSTKTTSVEKIVEKWNKSRPGEMPVVIVTLRSSTRNEKQLQVQILEAFQDPQADVVRRSSHGYSPDQAIRAIRNIARSKRTFIVVLDEANNMIGQDEIATARPMAKAIKSLVNEGVFSVVVMGTAKAHRLFEADPELNSRKIADINLDPVNLNVPSERRYFFKFVGQVDRQMERDGIVERRIGLIEDLRSRAMVYDMSGGVVGNVVRMLRIALRLAHRDKRRSIEWKDIEIAFYAWKTSQVDENGHQVEVYDPFAEGPQAQTLEAVKELG
ncbi:ATP-binding protein [Bradyrhizobium pachyrhizi]|uniref:ATP-binding protein n=1 Tax=Bradyrhizobium pachyrhizi TaxID=280333 RepID=UPI0024B1ACFD|nr:ATP-binding protein [Bradyrhizobium pachyrhizi]WFU53613.1 ATP-binding protein [Bradyrhizobium pachyrhizi]